MNEQDLFLRALQHPDPAERLSYLDQACNGQVQLRRRVEVLLQAHHRAADSFLESPAAGSVATIDHFPLAEKPGTIIGPYKLLQQIGEGGMGVVYMADQEQPVRRRVALKIIKPGMDSRQVIARFEAERQALAMMDHQNIAKVLDAGTTDSGRPYFVMELVHGVPITKFCSDNRLTLRERLELFVPVCQAIQHAHQKGVIHRDIKPTNILVTMYDDKPVPKVIDFGVAKAVEQRLTEKTLFTQYGMLVGTFEYMSPEQAEMNAFGVDTRSDVYSLGVLLYELLTGTTPIEGSKLRDAALVELVRLIKEEEPLRPSIRLSTSGALPKFAAACRTDAAQLPKQVRGELDWIVMKCLEKDRTRRYETVNGLAHDIQRYLHDEPVEACPPSPLYRLKKLAKKHRGLLATAASFVGLLLLAALVSTLLAAWAIQAQRTAQLALASERAARQEAESAKQRAEQAASRLSRATQLVSEGVDSYSRSNWAAAHDRFNQAAEVEPGLTTIYVHRGCLYTTLGLWDRAADDYERRFRVDERATAQTWFEHALLRYYVGDDAGYRRACESLQQQHGRANYWAHRAFVVRACLLSPQTVGKAEDHVREAEKMIQGHYVPWHMSLLAFTHYRAGQYEKAVERAREAIALGTGSPGGIHRLNFATLAMAQYQLGQKAQAEQSLASAEAAIEEWTKVVSSGPVGTMPVDWHAWLHAQLQYSEAERLIRGAQMTDRSRLSAVYHRALTTITEGDVFTFAEEARRHQEEKAWDQAADAYAQVLDKLPSSFRGATPQMSMCVRMVQYDEVFTRVVKLRPTSPHPWFARGRVLATAREWSKAVTDYERALELGIHSRSIVQLELAALYLLTGNETGYRDLCATIINERTLRGDEIWVQAATRSLTLNANPNLDLTSILQTAQSVAAKNPRIAWYLYALGAAQYRAGQYEEAIQSLEKSLEVHPAWFGRGQNFIFLALASHALDREDDAQKWSARAKEWMDQTDQELSGKRVGYAVSDYMCDWLSVLVLLPEAQALISGGSTP